MPRKPTGGLVLALIVLTLGCSGGTKDRKDDDGPGGEPEPQDSTVLKQIVAAYYEQIEEDYAPPVKAEDLRPRMGNFDRLDLSRYVIVWGVDPTDVRDPANTVLAYASGVPKGGGMVAFVNGSVRRVTAEEFRVLPRAASFPGIAARPAAYSLSTEEYLTEFKRNGFAAKEKYKRKIIELKGVVKGFHSVTVGNDRKVVLGAAGSAGTVECRLTEGQPWAKFSKGQQLTVKGVGPELQAYPHLVACAVTAAGPGTGVSATAEKIAAECEADPEGFARKYAEKSFVVTGEVARREEGEWNLKVYLKGTPKRPLVCLFSRYGGTWARAQRLAPGEKVKIYGEFSLREAVNLEECELIAD